MLVAWDFYAQVVKPAHPHRQPPSGMGMGGGCPPLVDWIGRWLATCTASRAWRLSHPRRRKTSIPPERLTHTIAGSQAHVPARPESSGSHSLWKPCAPPMPQQCHQRAMGWPSCWCGCPPISGSTHCHHETLKQLAQASRFDWGQHQQVIAHFDLG